MNTFSSGMKPRRFWTQFCLHVNGRKMVRRQKYFKQTSHFKENWWLANERKGCTSLLILQFFNIVQNAFDTDGAGLMMWILIGKLWRQSVSSTPATRFSMFSCDACGKNLGRPWYYQSMMTSPHTPLWISWTFKSSFILLLLLLLISTFQLPLADTGVWPHWHREFMTPV